MEGEGVLSSVAAEEMLERVDFAVVGRGTDKGAEGAVMGRWIGWGAAGEAAGAELRLDAVVEGGRVCKAGGCEFLAATGGADDLSTGFGRGFVATGLAVPVFSSSSFSLASLAFWARNSLYSSA